MIAQVIFSPLKDKGGVQNGWMNHLMQIFALFMLMGFFLSWLIPETNGITLEELSGETREDDFRKFSCKDTAEQPHREQNMRASALSLSVRYFKKAVGSGV